MSLEDNKQVVLSFLKAASSGDTDQIAAVTVEDMRYTIKGSTIIAGERDKDGLLGVVGMLDQLVDGVITLENMVLTAEEDRVAAEFTGRSTLVDGRPYENIYHCLFYVRDSKVCRLHEYIDTKYTDEVLSPLMAGIRTEDA